jgi:hypothetical protein
VLIAALGVFVTAAAFSLREGVDELLLLSDHGPGNPINRQLMVT